MEPDELRESLMSMGLPHTDTAIDGYEADFVGVERVEDHATATNGQLNAFALGRLLEYKVSRAEGQELLSFFQDDFDGWDTKAFERLPAAMNRTLRNTLRHGGVYTGPLKGVSITKQLSELMEVNMDEEDHPTWPDNALLKGTFPPGCAAHRLREE